MKRVVLVLRRTPLNHIKNLEAFRLGLGLTLSNLDVTVVMVDEGVFNAIEMKPEIVDRPQVDSFLNYYEDVGVQLLAEREALDKYGVNTLRKGVEAVERQAIVEVIRGADVVIPF
jgi:sulfur relay (sulfurtransferase) DsrF/TusC family protein